MWLNPQKIAYLVTFTEEIFNGKLQFLCYRSMDCGPFVAAKSRLLENTFLQGKDIANRAHYDKDLWTK